MQLRPTAGGLAPGEFAAKKRAQRPVHFGHGEPPARNRGQLVLKHRPGLGDHQEFQLVSPGKSEIPAYLQPQASAHLAQIEEKALTSHYDS